ncbi:hypothetical protein EV174_005731 [Coemansia sp. RSA 2320]|nr:hypothetical protein EV174_005731 [Coemansia sp. RSA 2320]
MLAFISRAVRDIAPSLNPKNVSSLAASVKEKFKTAFKHSSTSNYAANGPAVNDSATAAAAATAAIWAGIETVRKARQAAIKAYGQSAQLANFQVATNQTGGFSEVVIGYAGAAIASAAACCAATATISASFALGISTIADDPITSRQAAAAVAAASETMAGAEIAVSLLTAGPPRFTFDGLLRCRESARRALRCAYFAKESGGRKLSIEQTRVGRQLSRANRVRVAATAYSAEAYEMDKLVTSATNKAIEAAAVAREAARSAHAALVVNDFAAMLEAIARAASAAKTAEEAAASAAAVNIPVPTPYTIIND